MRLCVEDIAAYNNKTSMRSYFPSDAWAGHTLVQEVLAVEEEIEILERLREEE